MHGFSPALTSFVGRAGEVAEVAGLVEEYRLVTVTGPGGVGKTRLAAEVARRVTDRAADGAWLAALASVSDPALVPTAVATALGVPPAPGAGVMDSLTTVLARQRLLLVLDNCEHLLAVVAELCARLLPAADDVRVLGRRDLIAQADADRLARAARGGSPGRPGRLWRGRRPAVLAQPARSAVTATAAVFATAAVLIASRAGAGRWAGQQAFAGHWVVAGHVSAGHHFV